MTYELWKEIMTKLNKKMTKENRNILMFVDNNCSAHPESIKLSSIKFVFVPSNTTSRSKPFSHLNESHNNLDNSQKWVTSPKITSPTMTSLTATDDFTHNDFTDSHITDR
jgi:hypothetical protein